MRESGAKLAGEMSGHIFFADRYYGYDDAIYAALRVLEIVNTSQVPLSAHLRDLPKTLKTPEIRIDCEESFKFQIVKLVQQQLKQQHDINDLDGVRLDLPEAWGLLRASNTQAVLVARFEALNSKALSDIQNLFETALKDAIKTTGHPAIDLGVLRNY
jgi:phosphomannomutase/phosphoglucomutase